MTEVTKTNGYVSLTTLVLVAGTLATFLGAYTSLSIAPLVKDIEQNKQDIRDMRAEIVPRSEHQEKWLSQAAIDARQTQDIKDLSGSYSMRDEVIRLQRQVDCLESDDCRKTAATAQSR